MIETANYYHSSVTTKRQNAWKILKKTLQDKSISPKELSEAINISEITAMSVLKGGIDFQMTDDQYISLGKLTNHSGAFWKYLFGD